MRRVYLLPLLALILGLSFVSCSYREIGYAVVLWPEDGSGFVGGTVYPVIEESAVQETYTLLDGDEPVTVDLWRAAFFREESAADIYASRYEPWADAWARSLRTALPVREQDDRTSSSIYRLADGEIVKILDRLDEESDEAGLIDYWYRVLTREGQSGWVFGYYLELTTAGGRALNPVDDQDETARLVRDIAEQDWRPDYFRPMIQSGAIDLRDFGPQFGLFGSIEDGYFDLVLPGFSRRFEYTRFFSPVRNTIEFEGTSLILTVRGENELVAQYRLNDRERTTVFSRIEEDIDEIVAAELLRRRQLLDEIRARGDVLVSTAFGRMSIAENGTVVWEGYDRLVPDVLPTGFSGNGRLEFSLFPSEALRASYDGALRFRTSAGLAINFLYVLSDEGIRLVYVPENLISERIIVNEEPRSPVVIFYRFERS